MEEIFERLIRKIIFKKYPFLYEVKVKDLFEDIKGHPSLLGSSFVCEIKSEKCLKTSQQEEIDTEIKSLFSITYPIENRVGKKTGIQSFFDCGKGLEFKSSYGYKH